MQEGGVMGIYVYIELIHFVIQQKLTHHCKAIILHCLKNNEKYNEHCRRLYMKVVKRGNSEFSLEGKICFFFNFISI